MSTTENVKERKYAHTQTQLGNEQQGKIVSNAVIVIEITVPKLSKIIRDFRIT